MGFSQRRKMQKFYKALEEENPLVASASVQFFSTLKELAADETGDAPEPVIVSLQFADDAPRPAADLCLVGQYVTKVGSNLFGGPPYGAYWSEILDCCGAWERQIGPEHLRSVATNPKKATRTYNAKLFEAPAGWILVTPYAPTGGEGYYAPMSVFALIRVVREALAATDKEKLDRMLDQLAADVESGVYDPNDTLGQLVQVQDAMKGAGEIGRAHV